MQNITRALKPEGIPYYLFHCAFLMNELNVNSLRACSLLLLLAVEQEHWCMHAMHARHVSAVL